MRVRVLYAIEALALTAWVGSVWTTGLLVAPTLFSMVKDRQVAGGVAGQLFSATAFIGLICGGLIMLIRYLRGRTSKRRDYILWLVLAMVVITAIGQFGIQPVLAELRQQAFPLPVMQTELGARFAAWHAVSGALYLVQCLAGLVLVVLRASPQ